jgi:hypothetical protein
MEIAYNPCEVKRMKTISAKLPDKLANQLKALAATLNISEDELIARSLEEYLSKLEQPNDFEPIGFGMWKEREDMRDSTAWVRKLRETEWRR